MPSTRGGADKNSARLLDSRIDDTSSGNGARASAVRIDHTLRQRRSTRQEPESQPSPADDADSTPSLSTASTPPDSLPNANDTMFGGRKYTQLPTTQHGGSPSMNKRRGGSGGLGQIKKYCIIVGAGVLVVLFLAGGHAGKKYIQGGKQVADEAYDMISDATEDFNYDDFASPPFNPAGQEYPDVAHDGVTGADADVDEDAEGALHILPFPPPSKGNEGQSYGNPQGQELPDFAEVDAEEQDDYPPSAVSHQDDDVVEIDDSPVLSGHASSYETDPDPSFTTHCSRPHSEDSPLVQYALTIDAGSTGSRIHVYKFNNCGPAPALEYETFMAIQPGLSSFARDPTAAAASLDPLMQEALRVVPSQLHHCTPVEVKATAGLRLLPGREGQAILDEVRQRLEVDWPFSLGKEDSSVEIMDGKDEGVYAWITANYLLGNIGAGTTADNTTLAVMDLGGASTQIVFEPQFASTESQLAEGDHKYALTFGGRDFTLYQHSYLGYGLMRARRSVHNLVAFTWSFLQPGGDLAVDWDAMDEGVEVPNPCLTAGSTRRVELDPPGRKAVNVTMVGANGGFEACNRVIELVMAKDAICEVKPCSFNGVYQPSLLDTFPHGQFLALSYFTDRIKPLMGPYTRKGETTLSIGLLADMGKAVCAGPSSWKKKWRGDKAALAELADRPEYCLDLTFMHALLGLGYELGEDRELLLEKKLRGVELGWALGAGIAMLEKSTLTCTA